MPWQQLTLHTTAAEAETISNYLTELCNAQAVTYLDAQDQPLFEPEPGAMPLWQDIKMQVLFAIEQDLSDVSHYCQQHKAIHDFSVQTLADQAWERVCMQDFKPMQFGQRLWIVPSWCEAVDNNATNILLDPGLAFGTGTHGTTALCLQALDGMNLQHKTVIDFGCGSGILAIAASKLGAKAVYATDNDPQALQATHDNAIKNQIDLQHFHIEPVDAFPAIKADIVIANILAQPLIRLSDILSACCKHTLILSGILPEQTQMVRNAYKHFFDFIKESQLNGWVCLEALRQSC